MMWGYKVGMYVGDLDDLARIYWVFFEGVVESLWHLVPGRDEFGLVS